MREFTAQPLSSVARVLLRELSHRTNNELAAAISGVSLAATRSNNKDVKTALAAITELLHNYARVHRTLQMPEHDMFVDAAAYVRELCLAISHSQLDSR